MAAADHGHPDHDLPVWDSGDVARFCGVSKPTVRSWAEGGLLPVAEMSGEINPHYKFRPSDVIANTVVRRCPAKVMAKAGN